MGSQLDGRSPWLASLLFEEITFTALNSFFLNGVLFYDYHKAEDFTVSSGHSMADLWGSSLY
jgi:hypothetical protein